MHPGVDGIRLRPLSIGDLLDETFLVYKRQFVAFMTAMGLVIGLWIATDPTGPTSTRGSMFLQAGQVVVQAVGETLFGALAYILMTRFYYDLRVRKEAFDLEQRLALTEASLVPASR